MSKITLKTASLLLLTMASLSAWAQTPWAEEEATPAAQEESTAEAVDQAAEPLPEEPDSLSELMAKEEAEPEPAAEAAEPQPAATEEMPPAETQQPVVVQQQQGDVLAQPGMVRMMDFPRRGMSKDKVQNELGRPSEIIPPVGQPPITRWVYDDRIVYFEYSAVIHVVAK